MTKAYGTQKPQTTYLKDYQAPAYGINSIDLVFDVGEEYTTVKSTMQVVRRDEIAENLFLHGEELELRRIALNGNALGKDEFAQHNHGIELHNLPEKANIEIETRIYPEQNTSLMGLYQSSGNLCTQCEPEGFRKITYFLDRPDVLCVYTTTIIANREKFPVLLSNGNPVESGEYDKQRHWAKWHDPHPKPSYLFALVAGDLVALQDEFVTHTGKTVKLYIYTQKHNHDKCEHAMLSLKNAMAWDERVYGREYDLDVYNIVAVDDFNMGAMENKGLNIFNSKYVLAKPETATDSDYQGIEGVIGHEYFHNWSGNRVTCRDWFQLSLKEGFTVFRDQEFSADMGSRGVKRIEDVNILRSHQFREDAGPMSHPVRPDSYVEINNFYTLTVYNKGAEVIRMLHHLLGADKFRKGTDLYFQRHDGQAVTTDDFVKAMEDANATNLLQFKNWYNQAGTPVININQDYDGEKHTYTLNMQQSCENQGSNFQPFQIPLSVGLLDQDGNDMQVTLAGGESARQHVLNLNKTSQQFVFQDVAQPPIPSILRGFSAPVKIVLERSEEELAFLMAHDNDAFNRWDAGQQLGIKLILSMVEQLQTTGSADLSDSLMDAFRVILTANNDDNAMKGECLNLPSQAYLTEFMSVIDAQNLYAAWRQARQQLAHGLKSEFLKVYETLNRHSSYDISAQAIGNRFLKNTCLGYLMESGDPDCLTLCLQQFDRADNMTDVMAALSALNHYPGVERQQCLDKFYEKWKNEALVVDKWLTLQATSFLDNTLDKVKKLTKHEGFSIRNPNKVRSLIGAFCAYNHAQFHCRSGKAYEFLAENIIQLDELNPQIAARLATPFTQWRRYQDEQQSKMERQMQRVLAVKGLSKDVYEILSKSLA